MRSRLIWLALLILALPAGPGFAGRGKPLDTIWTEPHIERFRVERIAVLPIATYNNSLEAERTVEQAFGLAFRGSGHRWISASSTRDLLRARTGDDSLIKAVKAELVATARVDSLEAIRLCSWLHTDAVLGLRVDQWDRLQIEWNQSGKPYTQIAVHAALIDSGGRRLWTASGSNRGEGSYNDPNARVGGVTTSGLDFRPITAQAGAPSYAEVALPLFTRWVPVFPARSVADSTPAASR